MVLIRKACIDDLEEVVKLDSDLGYQVTAKGIRAALIHHIENPDYYLLVAEEQDEVMGMASFSIKYYLHREKPVLYIGSMVVKEKFRSQGIGGKLMEEVERTARQRGCNSIQLNSNKRRKGAHRFYENLGFAEVSLKYEKLV